MKISIVAPCLNEEGNIPEFCDRIDEAFKKFSFDYELVLINDGSTDNTWEAILEQSKSKPIIALNNEKNLGIFKSWKIGVSSAAGEFVCLMDSDLQNPPEAIKSLINKYNASNAHLVQGVRSSIEWHKDSRFYSSRVLNYLLNKFFKDSAKDNKSGFVFGPKKILKDTLNYENKYYFSHTFIRVSARSKGYLISEVETLFQPRRIGTSFLSNRSNLITYLRVLIDIFKARFEFKSFFNRSGQSLLVAPSNILQEVPAVNKYSGVRKVAFNSYFATMPLHAWLIRPSTKNIYENLQKTQWLKNESLRNLQFERLEKLVWSSYLSVPYYRRIFQERGIHPKDIQDLHDIEKIPLLTKSEVSTNMYMDLFSENHIKNQMHRISTSGSTGQPFTVYADRQQLEVRFATTLRSLEWTGWQFGDKQMRLWHQKIGMNRTQFIKEKLDAAILRRRFIPAFEITEDSIQNLVAQFNKYQPVLIDGYAESLNFLSTYINQGGKLEFSPKGIMSSAQMLTTNTRQQIETGFGCKVFDKYGAREFSGIAYQCGDSATNYHVMDESYIVEILKDNKPAKPGEIGEIVITDLNNFSFPLIRYRIGDLAKAVDNQLKCGCGRGLSQIGEIQGRTQALVFCANGRWLPGTFFAHFFKDYEYLVRFFQVIQEQKGSFVLKIVKGPSWNLSEWKDMINELKVFTGNTDINIEYVDEIPLLKTGKRTPVISHIKNDFQIL
jgi:phenylacetate-CoA ligase